MSLDRLARLRAAADAPDLTGTRYVLHEELGRGGMGTVYRAHDQELEREVALKVLSLPDADGALAARVQREARVLARLEHPSIVPVHDLGQLPDGRVYYVMKRVQGERLDAWLRRTGDVRGLVRVVQRVAEAVAFAHAHGVVHRDLKPHNLMVGAFGEAWVMDWGVAKVRGESAAPSAAARAPEPAGTAHGTVVGTPGFMAPEQARGEVDAVDGRADVFALGATLRALLPDPPPPLRAVLARACAEAPAHRYADALALAADLGAWLEGGRPTAHAETLPERCARLLRQHRVVVALIGAYLAMRVVMAWIARV